MCKPTITKRSSIDMINNNNSRPTYKRQRSFDNITANKKMVHFNPQMTVQSSPALTEDDISNMCYSENEMNSFRYEAQQELMSSPKLMNVRRKKHIYRRLTIQTVVNATQHYKKANTQQTDKMVSMISQKSSQYFVELAQLQAIHDCYDALFDGYNKSHVPLVEDQLPPKFPFPLKKKKTTMVAAQQKRQFKSNTTNSIVNADNNSNKRRRVVVAAMAC